MAGWIKLHRKLQQSPMYRALNCKQRDVFIQCLLLANHTENEWEWGAVIYKIEPGQFITSLESIASVCSKDVSVQSVRTALLKLERWGFLTNKSTKTGRLISITNWYSYQGTDEPTNKDTNRRLTNGQQTANKHLTANKNVKNVKNEKKVKNNYTASFDAFWKSYPARNGKKTGKAEAFTAYKAALKKISHEDLIAAVGLQSKSNEWSRDNGAYVPDAHRWLKKRRWEDEIVSHQSEQATSQRGPQINETPAEAKQRRAMEAIRNFGVNDEHSGSNQVHNGDVPVRVSGKVQYID
jgi:hypothetical protein